MTGGIPEYLKAELFWRGVASVVVMTVAALAMCGVAYVVMALLANNEGINIFNAVMVCGVMTNGNTLMMT